MPRRRNKRVELPSREAQISCLNYDGQGVVILEGKKTLIHGALAQERVMFSYRSQYSRYDEGVVEQILEPSKYRVEPGCPYFGQCGACELQHMSQPAQLQHKQKQMLSQMSQQANMEPQTILPPIVGNSNYGYRRKARLGVRYVAKKQRVLVGFRERGGRYLTNMTSCAVLHSSIGNKLDDLSDLIGKLDAFQVIPQIEAVVADNQVALCFRTLLPLSTGDRALLESFAAEENIAVYLQPGAEDSTELLWPKQLTRSLYYKHPDHQIQLEFNIHDFIQVNREVNLKLVDQVIAWLALTNESRVLDLFAGIGNFSLPIARYAKSVVAVEGSLAMVKQINHNAQLNDLANVEAYAADLSENIEASAWAQYDYDVCVLDPSRAGASEVMPWLIQKKIRRIAYVSCHHHTLAQDAALLAKAGYRLRSIGVADMFPHTTHIETLALFEL